MFKHLLASVLATALLLSASGATVYQTAKDAGLNVLVAAVEAAGLQDALNNTELTATVFAPTDEAFGKLLANLGLTAEQLLSNTKLLTSILTYHVVPGVAASASSLRYGQKLPTMYNEKTVTAFTSAGPRVVLGAELTAANVIMADVPADKAIVHVIDYVLVPRGVLPSRLPTPPDFESVAAAVAGLNEMPARVCDGALCKVLGVLGAAVEAAGLTDTLEDPEFTATIFAPTDAAFEAALSSLGMTAEQLLADEALLTAVLSYHVVPGVAAKSDSVRNGMRLNTLLDGSRIKLSVSRGIKTSPRIIVDGEMSDAIVVRPDITAGKSVIHVIDYVLLPNVKLAASPVPEASPSPAMEESPEMEEESPEMEEESPEMEQPMFNTLADAFEANAASLSTLQAALEAAELFETFNAPGVMGTVFAPTNEAFAKALANLGISAEQLLGNRELLSSFLAYHVVPNVAAYKASDLTNNQELPTALAGQSLTAMVAPGKVTIKAFGSEANVVVADVMAAELVIHVVDAVLIPNMAG